MGLPLSGGTELCLSLSSGKRLWLYFHSKKLLRMVLINYADPHSNYSKEDILWSSSQEEFNFFRPIGWILVYGPYEFRIWVEMTARKLKGSLIVQDIWRSNVCFFCIANPTPGPPTLLSLFSFCLIFLPCFKCILSCFLVLSGLSKPP